MKVKEIEYGETISNDFNNYRVVLRAEIDENEDVNAVMNELRKKVRSEIEKSIAQRSLNIEGRIQCYRESLIEIGKMIKELRNREDFIALETVRGRLNDIQMNKDIIERKLNELSKNFGDEQ